MDWFQKEINDIKIFIDVKVEDVVDWFQKEINDIKNVKIRDIVELWIDFKRRLTILPLKYSCIYS